MTSDDGSNANGNGLASAEDLLTTKLVRRYREVTLPVSGHRVRIRSLSELELSTFQMATLSKKGEFAKARLTNANRRLIVICLVDQAGNRLLNDTNLGALANWDGADAAFLYTECAEHCGIREQDIEELAKNLTAVSE